MASVNPENRAPLRGVEAALRRAGQRARELARQMHTPVVVFENGQIKRESPEPVAGVENGSDKR